LNVAKYRKLVAAAMPVVIKTEAENEHLLAIVEPMMSRKLSPEEKVGQLFMIWVRAEFLNVNSPQYLQLRDTMLVTKQVDAVTGFDSTTLLVLKANGMAIEDANVMSYADLGFNVYGNAFLVNPAFLQAKPDAVRAFVRAAVRGWPSPRTTHCLIRACARRRSSRPAGATFLPPAVTMISLRRPVMRR